MKDVREIEGKKCYKSKERKLVFFFFQKINSELDLSKTKCPEKSFLQPIQNPEMWQDCPTKSRKEAVGEEHARRSQIARYTVHQWYALLLDLLVKFQIQNAPFQAGSLSSSCFQLPTECLTSQYKIAAYKSQYLQFVMKHVLCFKWQLL